MGIQSVVRVKPTKPLLGSRIPLHALDESLSWFIPLNLFFRPSSSGPTELRDFAASLQDVVDRLPLIAGSIQSVDGPHGVKSKELVDDGRGVDLIWVESPILYADLLESSSLIPRSIMGKLGSCDETMLTVKFTKFTCGTLAMCFSMSHMFVDCGSYVDLIKEWARVSRGDSMAEALSVSSWNRNPGMFFPPPTPGAIRRDMRVQDEASHFIPDHGSAVMSNFFITWESLRELKDSCTPKDLDGWVSTGDCVGALLWRALTITRETSREPGHDVHMHMAVDGRSRSKIQPDASKYFGNLLIPIFVSLSRSALLEGSLASVALAIRHALDEQLTETNCANMLASFEVSKSFPGGNHISVMVNWARFPIVKDILDFGGGGPFWVTTGQYPAGMMMILPERDGYLCSLMVESDLAGKLQTIDELLRYAKPAPCMPVN